VALTSNPNKTRTLERKWKSEVNRRFASAWKDIRKISSNQITNFSDTKELELSLYIAELRRILNSNLYPPEWQNVYQREAYIRSMTKAGEEMRQRFPTEEALTVLILLGSSVDFTPIHKNELAFLSERANTRLAKWVNIFLDEVKEIIRTFGTSGPESSNMVRRRLAVARARARTIATTELTQASQMGVINKSAEMQESTGRETAVRWVTAADSLVRHLHAGWHGQVFSRDRARRNMTISPWNCRCGFRAVVINHDPARLKAQFTKERRALLAKRKN
jgi:uncharacterized protein with gpF-like domain